jgi:selenocysteine lyase/cysteine desulfurase
VPPDCELRPVDTGWYASFQTLAAPPEGPVPYSDGGLRFWGATFDASGLYRFNAAMDWLASMGTTVEALHRHSLALQKHFLDGLERLRLRSLAASHLVPPIEVARGNFLAFDVDGAEDLHAKIAAAGITIDRRERRLRFGFGIYHDAAQVEELLARLASAIG